MKRRLRRGNRSGDWVIPNGPSGSPYYGIPVALAPGALSYFLLMGAVAQGNTPLAFGGGYTSSPIPSRFRITEVDLTLEFYSTASNGTYICGHGLYVAEWDPEAAGLTGQWTLQNPLPSSVTGGPGPAAENDPATEDWIHLEHHAFSVSTPGFVQTYVEKSLFTYRKKVNVNLQSGQALILTNASSAISSGSFYYVPWIRVKVSQIT